jgi:hypothetical protein
MRISRASFGLVTQLLDLIHPLRGYPDLRAGEEQPASSAVIPHPSGHESWAPILTQARTLGVGALAEEVALGGDETVTRFMALLRQAREQDLELFLRLRDLTDEALSTLRELATEAAARLAPGETGPPNLRPIVDLGEPDEEDLSRWLPPRSPGSADEESPWGWEDGPGGGWSPAIAFSIFAADADAALRRLERVALPLLEASEQPGVELPVWLAAFGVGERGAAESPGDMIKVAAHALALGIERLFLAASPEEGWWPADLRSPPPPLQAFRTLAERLDGADRLTRVAAGQYRIQFSHRPDRYLLWNSDGTSRLPPDLRGPLEVTSVLGETRRVDRVQLALTDEPLFVDPLPRN